ncbi:MAG: MBL fold metallo-hydrolase [Methanobacteriota archaeon]|nr:MAG: MBL fold metallo-hydrolase [Euryarchaeota archaeon]
MDVEGNVQRIVVPTPLPLGGTNVYLIEEKPYTLIDTGPDTETTRADLQIGLGKIGLEMKDVERIVLTHGHVDHCGLAHEFANICNPEILAHEKDRDTIEDFGGAIEKRFMECSDLLSSTGAPPQTFQVIREFLDFLDSLTHPCKVTKTLKDKDKIEFESGAFEVLYTPGHSSGSISLHSEDVLFSGDALLVENSPCSVFGGADKKSVGLDDFLESMEKLSKLEAKKAYPGHGEPFEKVNEKIEGMKKAYESRKQTILDYLEKEELTAFELMNRVFGIMSIEQVLMGLGEILGHLEILAEDKAVETKEKEGLTYYKV